MSAPTKLLDKFASVFKLRPRGLRRAWAKMSARQREDSRRQMERTLAEVDARLAQAREQAAK